MSVNTEAKECIERAKENLSQALKELQKVLSEDTTVHSDMSNSYIDTVAEIAIDLMKIKRKL